MPVAAEAPTVMQEATTRTGFQREFPKIRGTLEGGYRDSIGLYRGCMGFGV